MLADMVRTDFHQLREAAGDSPEAAGIEVLARTHKTMIWEQTRETQRLRHQLLEYYPAALETFSDLDAPGTLELLGRAPDPRQGRELTRAQVSAAMKRAGRRNITERATAVLTALHSDQLTQPEVLAYATTVPVITALNEQAKLLEEQVREYFGRHPDAEIMSATSSVGRHPVGPALAGRGVAAVAHTRRAAGRDGTCGVGERTHTEITRQSRRLGQQRTRAWCGTPTAGEVITDLARRLRIPGPQVEADAQLSD